MFKRVHFFFVASHHPHCIFETFKRNVISCYANAQTEFCKCTTHQENIFLDDHGDSIRTATDSKVGGDVLFDTHMYCATCLCLANCAVGMATTKLGF